MTTPPLHDPVNSPYHYTAGGLECIDAIHAALGDEGFLSYCRGNAIKYLWRANHKGRTAQDLRKAEWYVRRAAELQEHNDRVWSASLLNNTDSTE
jgi:hypothetical protein